MFNSGYVPSGLWLKALVLYSTGREDHEHVLRMWAILDITDAKKNKTNKKKPLYSQKLNIVIDGE